MKYIVTLFLLLPTLVFSQGWETTFDNGQGWSVQQTTDGGYIVVGGTYSDTLYDIYLIKTDENGVTLWTKTYDGGGNDFGYSVQQTADGGYIITGNITLDTINNSDVSLIKTDEYGDTLWTRTYGGVGFDCGKSVQQTIDEGYIVTGITDLLIRNGREIYLIKTDVNGDTLWTKTYGGEYSDSGYSVQQTTDGGYIITGSIGISEYSSDLYLIKTDGNGDTLWTKTYGENYWSGGHSVQQTTDGGYIITGADGTSTHMNLYLIKTDGNGDTLWTKTHSVYNWTNGWSGQQTADGGYIITGYTYSFDYDRDVFLIKTDGNGDTLWTRICTYGDNSWDFGYSVQQTTDEGYIVTGITESFGMGTDIYLIKTDENGFITTIIEIPTPNPNRKLIKIIDLLGRDIIYPKKNTPYIEIYDDGTSQKKIIK